MNDDEIPEEFDILYPWLRWLASALDALDPDVLPLPGESHPAVSGWRDLVESYNDRSTVMAPLMRSVSYCGLEEPVMPVAPALSTLTFTKTQAWQSFYPDLGAWVWPVWRDELGRYIACRAQWVRNPSAVMRAPFNPVEAEGPSEGAETTHLGG